MSKNLTGRGAAALRAEQERQERGNAAQELAEQAVPETEAAAPETCPCCGGPMELGKICLGNTVRPFWQPMNTSAMPFTFLKPSGGVSLKHTGVLSPDLPAWYCRRCKKVLLDTD